MLVLRVGLREPDTSKATTCHIWPFLLIGNRQKTGLKKNLNWVRVISDINNHRWLVNGETSLTCDDFGTTKKVFRSKLGFPMAQTVRRQAASKWKSAGPQQSIPFSPRHRNFSSVWILLINIKYHSIWSHCQWEPSAALKMKPSWAICPPSQVLQICGTSNFRAGSIHVNSGLIGHTCLLWGSQIVTDCCRKKIHQ